MPPYALRNSGGGIAYPLTLKTPHTRLVPEPTFRYLVSFSTCHLAVFRAVISARSVVFELRSYDCAEVKALATSKVKDADNGIREFDFQHGVLREVVVVKAFAVTFHAFSDFGDDEHKLFSGIVGLEVAAFIRPPAAFQSGFVRGFGEDVACCDDVIDMM
jgi:hypothetical protein